MNQSRPFSQRFDLTLRQEAEHFRKIFRFSNDAIFLICPNQDRILNVNPRACTMLGYTRDELLSLSISAIHPDDMDRVRAFARKVFAAGVGRTNELNCVHKSGTRIPTEINASTTKINGHQCLITIVKDISGRLHSQQKLEQTTRRLEFEKAKLEEVLEIEEGVSTIVNLDKLVDFVIDKTTAILNAQRCSLIFIDEGSSELCIKGAKGLSEELIRSSRPDFNQSVSGFVAHSGQPLLVRNIETDSRFARRNRTSYKGRSFISAPIKSDDTLIGILNVSDKGRHGASDFDEIDLKVLCLIVRQVAVAIENNRLYRELKYLTITDPLTNIYNYRHFASNLDREIHRIRRYPGDLCLLMLDIDDFKSYNDSFGHLEGDVLLKEISTVLKNNLREVDIACRYAGDEFVVILPATALDEAKIVAEKIRVQIKSLPLRKSVTVSMGLAALKEKMDRHDLIMRADFALYRAKNTGKNRVCLAGPKALKVAAQKRAHPPHSAAVTVNSSQTG